MKNKLEIGDEVEILPCKPDWRYEGPIYVREMDKYAGYIFEVRWIESTCDDKYRYIRLEGCPFTWLENWLELVGKRELIMNFDDGDFLI